MTQKPKTIWLNFDKHQKLDQEWFNHCTVTFKDMYTEEKFKIQVVEKDAYDRLAKELFFLKNPGETEMPK